MEAQRVRGPCPARVAPRHDEASQKLQLCGPDDNLPAVKKARAGPELRAIPEDSHEGVVGPVGETQFDAVVAGPA
jgi:hypothetical protein